MEKRLLLTIAILLTAASGARADYSGLCGTSVTYSYVESTRTLTISGTGDMADYYALSNVPWNDYKPNISTVVIGDGVTRIGKLAFQNCTSLTSATIPNSVTSIGESAFEGCTSLASVAIPSKVSMTGSYAFYGCTSLTSVNIPASLTSIGDNSFTGCSALETITVDAGNTVYDSRDNCNAIIYNDYNEIIEKSEDILLYGCKNTVIPSGVTKIGAESFFGCTGLTSIEIPGSVTSIGNYAFYGCTGLSSIEIPEGVTTIWSNAFEGCTRLTSIEIPASVTSIGAKAFNAYTGDHVYVVVPEGKQLIVTIDGVTDPVVIEPTEGKADILDCLFADPVDRTTSRALIVITVYVTTAAGEGEAPNVEYFSDFFDAVTAANAATSDCTVTLLNNVDLGETYVTFDNGIDDGNGGKTPRAKITLDLNGKTITGSGNEAIEIAAATDVTIVSSAEGGKVSNGAYQCDGIANSGTLTVSGIDIFGSEIGIYNIGTLTITDCNVSGYDGIHNNGEMTVSGGSISGSFCGIFNSASASSATIEAVTIKSSSKGIRAFADVTLTAWPTFSGNGTDITLFDGAKIVLGDGFKVPATEYNKIKITVKATGDDPLTILLTITSGYAAHCKDGQNNVIDPASVFSWEGSNNNILTLNDDEVVVTNKIPTEINIEEGSLELVVLDEVSTGATLTPADAGNLVYTSSNEDIATVDENGKVTAVSAGTATITVSFAGNDTYAAAESKTIAVAVVDPTVSVTIGETTTKYATLAKAVAAANAADEATTITLYADVDDVTSSISLGNAAGVTLDLNGKSLQGEIRGAAPVNYFSIITVPENTKLTICDSGTGGNVYNSSSGSDYLNAVYNSGTLVIAGGTFKTGYSDGDKAPVIYNAKDATLTVSGGTIGDSEENYANGIAIYDLFGTINITGGTIIFSQSGINCRGTLNVSGGTFVGNDKRSTGIHFAGYEDNSFKMNALPTFQGEMGTNIVLYAYEENVPIDFTDAEAPIFTAAPATKLTIGCPDLTDGAYALTKGYSTHFVGEGGVIAPDDVFTVSGANVVLAGGEVIAYDSDKPLVAVNTASNGSLTGVYAQNGDNITTDADALTAAVYALADGSTLTLCMDVDLGDNDLYIQNGTADKPVTLDLNSHNITGKKDYCVLDIDDTVIIKNGTIENNCTEASPAIINGGNLTLTDVSVTSYDAINNYGTLTIESGTFTAKGSYGFGIWTVGTLTISGGSIGYQNAGIIVDDGTVTLAGMPTFTPAEGSSAPEFALGIHKTTNSDTGEDEYTLNGKIAFSTEGVDVSALTSKLRVMPTNDYQNSIALPVPLQFTTGFSNVTKSGVDELLPCDVFEVVEAEGCHMGIGEMSNEACFAPYAVETVSLPAGWSTWYDDRYFSVENAPDGITAYAVTKVEGTDIIVTALPEGKINSYLPVLLYNGTGASAEVEMITSTGSYFAREYSRSLVSTLGNGPFYDFSFIGTNAGKTLSANDETIYYGCNGEAFVPLDLPATVAAHRCWIEIGGMTIGNARKLNIVFDGENATGMDSMDNGQWTMDNGDDTWYTIDGRKLGGKPTKKGIYIQNGKKRVIK